MIWPFLISLYFLWQYFKRQRKVYIFGYRCEKHSPFLMIFKSCMKRMWSSLGMEQKIHKSCFSSWRPEARHFCWNGTSIFFTCQLLRNIYIEVDTVHSVLYNFQKIVISGNSNILSQKKLQLIAPMTIFFSFFRMMQPVIEERNNPYRGKYFYPLFIHF